jgi:hypothetical protein
VGLQIRLDILNFLKKMSGTTNIDDTWNRIIHSDSTPKYGAN